MEPATRGPWGGGQWGLTFRTQAAVTASSEKGDMTGKSCGIRQQSPAQPLCPLLPQSCFKPPGGLPERPTALTAQPGIIQYELPDPFPLWQSLCPLSPHTLSSLLFPGRAVLSMHSQPHLCLVHFTPSDSSCMACFPSARKHCSSASPTRAHPAPSAPTPRPGLCLPDSSLASLSPSVCADVSLTQRQ